MTFSSILSRLPLSDAAKMTEFIERLGSAILEAQAGRDPAGNTLDDNERKLTAIGNELDLLRNELECWELSHLNDEGIKG